jgi:hypothetical protein
MDDLELGLQIPVLKVHIFDILISLEVLLDFEGHEELGQVGSFFAVLESGDQEVDYRVDDSFVALDQPLLPLHVKGYWVVQHLQKLEMARKYGVGFLKEIVKRWRLRFYFEEFGNSVGSLFLEFFFYVHAVRLV